jgi:hypothetical protein
MVAEKSSNLHNCVPSRSAKTAAGPEIETTETTVTRLIPKCRFCVLCAAADIFIFKAKMKTASMGAKSR